MASKNIQFKGGDITIFGRPGDYYFRDLCLDTNTNDFLLYALDRYIHKDAVILDIGANIGLTAAIFSKVASDGQVLAFEPDPDTFVYLQQTVEANALRRCALYQIALGAQAGTLAFMSDPNDSTGNRLAPKGTALGGGNRKVEVRRLDDFLAQMNLPKIDFIKLDVEGFELDVLSGAVATLNKFRPKLLVEFNSFTLIAFGNRNPRDLINFLRTTFP